MQSAPSSRSASFLLLVAAVFVMRSTASGQPTDPVPISPGHWEIRFRGGKVERAEVISVEGTKVRLRLHDGGEATFPSSVIEDAKVLSSATESLVKARTAEEAGDHESALRALEEAASLDPTIDLEEQRDRLARAIAGREASQLAAERADLLEAVARLEDRMQYQPAIDLLKAGIAANPYDEELIARALFLEYLLHRRTNGTALGFRSALIEPLSRLNPKSDVLMAVQTGRAIAVTDYGKWEELRRASLVRANAEAEQRARREKAALFASRNYLPLWIPAEIESGKSTSRNFSSSRSSANKGGTVQVRGHWRNGRWIEAHTRAAPGSGRSN